MIASRTAVLIALALAGAIVVPGGARAQWWSRAPADFEECADKAEKATGKDERKTQLSACNAKFAGRRKPGGGYSYFDFMQNRSFDISGPNPTPAEQKKIDEHYTAFLDRERQSRFASDLTARQQLLQQVSLRTERIPLPAEAPNKRQAAVSESKPASKRVECAQDSFSCKWPRLSEGINELKKLFGSSPAKAKRS